MRTKHHSTFALRYSLRSPWYGRPTLPLTSVDSACNSRTEASGCGRSGRMAGAIVFPTIPHPTSRFGPTSYDTPSVAHSATTRRLATLSTPPAAHQTQWVEACDYGAAGRKETLASRGSNPRRRTPATVPEPATVHAKSNVATGKPTPRKRARGVRRANSGVAWESTAGRGTRGPVAFRPDHPVPSGPFGAGGERGKADSDNAVRVGVRNRPRTRSSLGEHRVEDAARLGSIPSESTRTAACPLRVHSGMEARLAVHPFIDEQYNQKPPPVAPSGLRPQPPTGTASARACGLHRRETIPDNDTNDADTNNERNGT